MPEHLKRNALDFFNEAKRNLNEGKYNLAMFHLEQALQLSLKYILFNFKGSFEKTHDILRLLDEVISLKKNENLQRIRREETLVLELITQAYIASRYLPFSYERITVEKAYNVVKNILNEVGIL
jgi:HEPN domain-containing protein